MFILFYFINLLICLLLLMIFFLLKHTEPTSGGSMRKRATMMPSCSSMRRKAMISWAHADMKRGFFVQIFFLLPARIRAMRFVWGQIPNIIRTYSTYWICCNLRSPFLQSTHCYYADISMKNINCTLFTTCAPTISLRPYLGDKCRVAHGRWQAYSQSLEVAMDDVGFGYEAKGTQVSQTDTCQYYVTQFPTGRFHDWSVPESEYPHS